MGIVKRLGNWYLRMRSRLPVEGVRFQAERVVSVRGRVVKPWPRWLGLQWVSPAWYEVSVNGRSPRLVSSRVYGVVLYRNGELLPVERDEWGLFESHGMSTYPYRRRSRAYRGY